MAIEFFDCNVQIGRGSAPEPASIQSTREIAENLQRLGISRALVHHALSVEWHPAEGNVRVLDEINELPFEAVWVAMPHHTGDMPEPGEFISQMRKHRVRAVRIYPAMHQWRMSNWCAGELFAAFEDARVPVFVELSQTNWDDVASLLSHHPHLSLVVLQTGYRCDRYIYPLLERYAGFAIESGAYQVSGGIEAIVRRFGARALVFGTNLPFREPGAAVAQITYAEISDEDKRAIASGNLERLLSWI